MATNGASDALKLERLLKKLKHALKAGDTDGVEIMSKKIVKAGGTVPEVSPGAKRKTEAEPEAVPEQPPSTVNTTGSPPTSKKAKKAAKKTAAAAAVSDAPAVHAQQTSLPHAGNPDTQSDVAAPSAAASSAVTAAPSANGTATKSGKKKAKAAAAAAAATEPPQAAAVDQSAIVAVDGKASSKSGKKDGAKALASANGSHSSGAGAGEESIDLRALAEVGDVNLARSGKAIVKALYKEAPEVAAMTAAEVERLRAERDTAVSGPGASRPTAFKPLRKFEQTGLPPALLHSCRQFTTPSPIQSQCWPIVLSGRDLIGIAATGSGKTLGFGLPMMAHINAQKAAGVVGRTGPYAVVMAPTRELALQINAVLEDAGSKCGVSSVCVYGGVSKKEQVDALRKGVEVVVGTPGRVRDLMSSDVLKLREVTYLVLDEADRMLDLGFEPEIRAICSTVRSDRQTLMFSATWPSAVQKLAATFLSQPVKVTIGSQDLAASHSITQHVEVIEPHARDDRLLQLLSRHHANRSNRIIIFVLYKKEAPRVEGLLQRKGWKCAAIHGDISQDRRTAAVDDFKSGRVPLLIATDVAARGLDIPDVEVVINYSFPLTTEDYVHRIGRTGRAGKTGLAFTFFCAAADKPRAGELINVLKEAGQKVPEELLKFGTAVKKKESKLYGSHFKDVDISAKATKVKFDSDEDD
ncbi:hypothetical protein QJQ45_007869 [Haematococcus lacustris]|nr:hypothetical protein QJQ45_007869 [Haematococcus lacustris]